MKTLKIFLVFLIPALGFVGCKKSSCQPDGTVSVQHTDSKSDGKDAYRSSGATSDTDNLIENNNKVTDFDAEYYNDLKNKLKSVEFVEEENGTPVVGSGDDDRDGGDRKQKKAGR